MTGITRGTTAAHLARATLEGIAFEVWDLLEAMQIDSKRTLGALRVDGGAAANDLLMQFQADVARVVVERPTDLESTGRGAAMLAGVGAGLCDISSVTKMLKIGSRLEPTMAPAAREAALAGWKDALRRARSNG